MNIPLSSSTETENNMNHTVSLHRRTFLPSSGPIGKRLNVASNKFTKQTKPTRVPQNPICEKKK